MKPPARRSLSSVLAAVVGVLFIVVAVGGLLLTVFLSLAIVKGTGRNVTLALPATFTIAPSAYELVVPKSQNIQAQIEPGAEGKVVFRGGGRITCFYAEIDPIAGRLRYVNAGHNPPYLFDHGEARMCGPTGIVLGMLEAQSFEAVDVDVTPGVRLLVYTDGITEASNLAGDEFGSARLEALAAEIQERTPDAAVDAVFDRVAAFVGRAPQHDDMTVMLVTIPPVPAA